MPLSTGPLTAGQTGLYILIGLTGLLLLGTLVLSAYALLKRAQHQRRARQMAALSDRWLEPLLGALGDPEGVSSVQALVHEDDEIRFLEFAIEYARRLRGEGRGVLREIARPFLPRVVERTTARGTELRAWGVQVLGTLGLPEYEKEVIAALDDSSQLVAMVAARALARRETPQYAPEVLARLDRFSEWNRMFLASMLASMGPEVSPELRAGLADTTLPPQTRSVMAEALLRQGDFTAADVAAEIAGGEADTELMASVLRLLAAVGRPDHAAVVRPHCTSAHPAVRAQALKAIGFLGGEEDVPMLLEAMKDESPWPALYAARGARDAGGAEALQELVGAPDARSALAQQVLGEGAAR